MDINEKIKLHGKLEEEIIKEASDKGQDECSCNDPEIFKFIHEGNWDEIMNICINCGGFIQ